MKILKKNYKRILIVLIATYVVSIYVSQQQSLNDYNKQVSNYEEKIVAEQETNKSLLAEKDNVNSPEYIEQIAREKLGMYLPNEKVYIDVSK